MLDLMLPGTYGMDMLKQLRTFSEVPVLVLSARTDASDKSARCRSAPTTI